MRTGRSLPVCCSLLPGGDLPGPGGSPRRGGSPWSGGVCLVRGGSPWSGGLPAKGGSPWSGGVSLPRGVVFAWSQGGFSGDPPVNRITDTCKNITLATTSLRPVTRLHSSRMRTARFISHHFSTEEAGLHPLSQRSPFTETPFAETPRPGQRPPRPGQRPPRPDGDPPPPRPGRRPGRRPPAPTPIKLAATSLEQFVDNSQN